MGFTPGNWKVTGISVRGQSPGPGPITQLWDLLAEGEAPARHLPPPSPQGTQGIQVCGALGPLGTVGGSVSGKTLLGPVCEPELEVPWQAPEAEGSSPSSEVCERSGGVRPQARGGRPTLQDTHSSSVQEGASRPQLCRCQPDTYLP